MKNIKNRSLLAILALMISTITLPHYDEDRSNDGHRHGRVSSGFHRGYSGESDGNQRRGLFGWAGEVTGAAVAVPATVVGADTRYNDRNERKNRKNDRNSRRSDRKSNKRKRNED